MCWDLFCCVILFFGGWVGVDCCLLCWWIYVVLLIVFFGVRWKRFSWFLLWLFLCSFWVFIGMYVLCGFDWIVFCIGIEWGCFLMVDGIGSFICVCLLIFLRSVVCWVVYRVVFCLFWYVCCVGCWDLVMYCCLCWCGLCLEIWVGWLCFLVWWCWDCCSL